MRFSNFFQMWEKLENARLKKYLKNFQKTIDKCPRLLYNNYSNGETQMKDYFTMYGKACNGEITEQEWNEYVLKVLEQIMIDNKNVLTNLKYL